MKSLLAAIAWLLPAAVVQTTLVPRHWPLDLFLLLAALNALRRSPRRAAAEGMLVGLVQDFAGGGLLGLNASSKALAAGLVAWPQRRFSGYLVVIGTVLVFAASWVERGVKLLLLASLGTAPASWTGPWLWMPTWHAVAAILLLTFGVWAAGRRRQSSTLLMR